MLDLSIIIPVYNTPVDALQRCFGSLSQFREIAWEALVIDDGSQEETAAFCKNYAEKNSSFRYFRKANGGVSSARNYGLSQATGSYITFLDADDIILPAAFTKELLQANCDLAILDINLVENGHDSVWHGFDREEGPLTKDVLLRQLIVSKSLNGPYAKLFKRQIIADKNIRFDTDFVTGEDWDFVCSFALEAETVTYHKVPSYVYFRDGGNSKGRINRFPDVVLHNLIAMFRRKQEIVAAQLSNCPEAASMLSTAAAFLVEDLFNSAADLLVLGKLTRERKETIRVACRSAADFLLPTAPKKARVKVWVTRYFWIGVYPLAYLRELYLKRH